MSLFSRWSGREPDALTSARSSPAPAASPSSPSSAANRGSTSAPVPGPALRSGTRQPPAHSTPPRAAPAPSPATTPISPPSRPSTSSGPSATPALDPARDSGFLPTEAADEVLTHFHQVPAYHALLTVGPDAVYQLPPALHEKLIALDTGAKQARRVRSTLGAAERQALEPTVKAVKGALRTRQYAIGDEIVVEPHVMRDILRHAGTPGKGNARGGPMQLFDRWIELAVPTGATDLHVEIRGHVALVRVRVDGRMEPLPDGQSGRYSRKEAIDAIAAGYNSTRKGNNVSQYHAEQFVDCMIDLNVPVLFGHPRYQNI